jgi:hypothetical protein
VIVQEDDDADVAVAAGLIGFTAGIAIGAAMDNNYYYGPYGWRGGAYMYNDAWDDYYDHREDAGKTGRITARISSRSAAIARRTDRNSGPTVWSRRRSSGRPPGEPSRETGGVVGAAERAERTGTRAAAQRSTTPSATSQTQRTTRTGSTEARGYGSGSQSQPTHSTEQRRVGRVLGIFERAPRSVPPALAVSRAAAAVRAAAAAARSGGGRRR